MQNEGRGTRAEAQAIHCRGPRKRGADPEPAEGEHAFVGKRGIVTEGAVLTEFWRGRNGACSNESPVPG
jgi:hypothetical protein